MSLSSLIQEPTFKPIFVIYIFLFNMVKDYQNYLVDFESYLFQIESLFSFGSLIALKEL